MKAPLFPATKEGVLKHAEYLYLEEVLAKFPDGILAYVGDSYDYFAFVTEVLPLAKDTIMSRDGKLVVRGDSGDPVDIIAGTLFKSYSKEPTLEDAAYKAFLDNFDPTPECEDVSLATKFLYKTKHYEVVYAIEYNNIGMLDNWACKTITEFQRTSEEKGTIELLYEIFGGTVNDLGYKVLDSHIGMIYGDGITIERATSIFERLSAKGFASLNIVFGVGAYSLASLSRDDLGIAVKATAAEVVNEDGITEWVPVYKEPKTDSSKKSAKGLLKVTFDSDTGLYVLQDNVTPEEELEGELKTVFLDGKILVEDTFEEIKQRLYK